MKTYQNVLMEQFRNLNTKKEIEFEITKEDIGEFCKVFLKDLVKESKVIKESLSFSDHLKMYKEVSNLSEDEMISLVFFEGEVLTEEKIGALGSKLKKAAALGFAAVAGGVGIQKIRRGVTATKLAKDNPAGIFQVAGQKRFLHPKMVQTLGKSSIKSGAILAGVTLAILSYFIYKNLNDPCRKKCKSDKNQKLCYYMCAENAAKKVLMNLKSELGKCGKTKNPDKCKKKITKEIQKWQGKVEDMHRKVVKYKTASMS